MHAFRSFISFLFLLGAAAALRAQPATFQWADVISSSAYLRDLDVSSDGRTLVLAMTPYGGFTGGAWTDEMVVSISSSGETLWTTDGLPTIKGICLDADGSTYVAGTLRQHINSPTALPPNYFAAAGFPTEGSGAAYIAKFTWDGVVEWVRQVGTSMLIVAYGVAVEPSGSYYVAGVYKQTAPRFGDIVIPTPANRDELHLFLARFNPEGKAEWVKAAVTRGLFHEMTKVSVDSSGRILLEGAGSLVRFYGEEVSVAAEGKLFNVYLNQAGEILSYSSDAVPPNQEVYDSHGNRYVVQRRDENHTNNTLRFEVEKYGANGDLVWTRSAAVSHGGGATCRVYLDHQQNPILAGSWGARGTAAGVVPGEINFGNVSRLTTTSLTESYVAKYDDQGQLLWALQSEGLEPVWIGDAPPSYSATGIQRVLFDEDGDVIVIGSLKGSVQFGELNLLGGTSGSTSVFGARITQTGGAPALSVTMTSPEDINIRWPVAAVGYVLERAESLTESSWTTVTSPRVEIGSDHAVSISREAAAMFFRLRKQ